MINASHTHAGPALGNYNELEWEPAPRTYLGQLDRAIIQAVEQAIHQQQPVRIKAARGTTSVPMNRRRLMDDGSIFNAPNPDGPIYDALPVVLLESHHGEPVCLLFSASTHAVCYGGTEISADYPGAAMAAMDAHLGKSCSLFLQGMAGDSRPRTLANGASWLGKPLATETRTTGLILAQETIATLPLLREFAPRLRTALLDTHWPLQLLTREEYHKQSQGGRSDRMHWAKDTLAMLDAGTIKPHASILVQGFQLGEGLRIIAIEGEPLHPYGKMVEEQFNTGLTLATGYANGEGMYLVTTEMLSEGGYEPGSYWEYHQAGPLAPGMEQTLIHAIKQLQQAGIE